MIIAVEISPPQLSKRPHLQYILLKKNVAYCGFGCIRHFLNTAILLAGSISTCFVSVFCSILPDPPQLAAFRHARSKRPTGPSSPEGRSNPKWLSSPTEWLNPIAYTVKASSSQ